LTNASGIEIFDMNASIAETAARLQATYNLKIPDSIQLATALDAQADYFLTNDIKLKTISELVVVTVDELR
jgi:predicted nucleic acid-binding protein